MKTCIPNMLGKQLHAHNLGMGSAAQDVLCQLLYQEPHAGPQGGGLRNLAYLKRN